MQTSNEKSLPQCFGFSFGAVPCKTSTSRRRSISGSQARKCHALDCIPSTVLSTPCIYKSGCTCDLRFYRLRTWLPLSTIVGPSGSFGDSDRLGRIGGGGQC